MTDDIKLATHSSPYAAGWFFCYTCNREVQAELTVVALPKEGFGIEITVYAMCHHCGKAGLKATTTMSLESI